MFFARIAACGPRPGFGPLPDAMIARSPWPPMPSRVTQRAQRRPTPTWSRRRRGSRRDLGARPRRASRPAPALDLSSSGSSLSSRSPLAGRRPPRHRPGARPRPGSSAATRPRSSTRCAATAPPVSSRSSSSPTAVRRAGTRRERWTGTRSSRCHSTRPHLRALRDRRRQPARPLSRPRRRRAARARPTTRCSCTARPGSARRTCWARSPTTSRASAPS